jgi:hypothetical protein
MINSAPKLNHVEPNPTKELLPVEQVETMARALFKIELPPADGVSWSDLSDPERKYYGDSARAALEAARPHLETMLTAARREGKREAYERFRPLLSHADDAFSQESLRCTSWDRDYGECGRCGGCKVRSLVTAIRTILEQSHEQN